MVVAPSSMAIAHTSAVNSMSARVASIGENSTSSTYSLRVGDGGARLALDVLARGLELVLDVDVRGRDEGVDARALGVLDRLVGGVDVRHVRARQARDDRALDRARDRLHGLEVARRGDREPGLDDVDAQAGELLRDLELLAGVERDAGRLLAVAQRRVEDQYSVGVLGLDHVVCSCCLVLRLLLAGFAATRPPRAIPPEGGGEEGEGRGESTCELRVTGAGAGPEGAPTSRAG